MWNAKTQPSSAFKLVILHTRNSSALSHLLKPPAAITTRSVTHRVVNVLQLAQYSTEIALITDFT